MEFAVAREEFLQAVAKAAQIASARAGVAALGGVLVRWAGGEAVLSATNLDLAIEARVAVRAEGEGEALVPARLLGDVVRAAPEGELRCRLEPQENGFVVEWGSGRLVLRTLHREDYPDLSFSLGEHPAVVPTEGFVAAIGQVARAASRDETRPILTGIRVDVGGGRAELVATDSYRLAVRRLERGAEGEFSATVPAAALHEVARVAGQGAAEEIKLAVVDRRAVFAVGPVVISSRLLEGQFPDYKQLLPEDPPVELELEREEVAAVLRRVGLVAQKNVPVALALGEGELVVFARTPDVGEARERLDLPYSGEALTVGFNPTYIRDGIEAVRADRLRLRLTNSVRPGVIEANEEDGLLLYLVMPVRMEE